MKLEDAPPAGWYPDPERSGRLRWWDGLDWSDSRRAPPSDAELDRAARTDAVIQPIERQPATDRPPPSRRGQVDSDELITQVRQAARDEVNRAADVFSQRARTAARQARDVVGDYVGQILRWIRIVIVVLAVLVIAWFVFQFIAQATFLSWLGDRIDNLFDG